MRKLFRWKRCGATHMAQEITTRSRTQFTRMAMAAKITMPTKQKPKQNTVASKKNGNDDFDGLKKSISNIIYIYIYIYM